MITYILTREEIAQALTSFGKIRYSRKKSLTQSAILAVVCVLNIYYCFLRPGERVYYIIAAACAVLAALVWIIPLQTRKNQINAAYTGDPITLEIIGTAVRVTTLSGTDPWQFEIDESLNYKSENDLIIINPAPGKLFIIPKRVIEADSPLGDLY